MKIIFLEKVKWLLYDFSCLRFIWSKILPPTAASQNKRPPSTFLFWLFGSYLALFGLASQRYENKIDFIENRINSIQAQLGSHTYKYALGRISNVQNLQCPYKPELFQPYSVFRSLFGQSEKYKEADSILIEVVENFKDSLESVDLSNANLEGAQLDDANLKGAYLINTNLKNVSLVRADLRNAIISGTKFENANLQSAEMTGLKGDFPLPELVAHEERGGLSKGFSLMLKYKTLGYYDLVEELSKAKSLCKTKLNPELEQSLIKEFPKALDCPVPPPITDFKIESDTLEFKRVPEKLAPLQ